MTRVLHLSLRPFFFICSLILLFGQIKIQAQNSLIINAPQSNTLAAGFFIPNSTSGMAYSRAAFYIHRQEMAPYANVSLTSFSIPLINNTNTLATVGNFTLYFQNTQNNRLWLPWNFAFAISPMTVVYAGTLSIPAAGTNFISVNLQTPFIYSGAGLNVAYAWENPGPYTNNPVNAACTDEFTGIEDYGTQFWTQFGNSSVSPPANIGGNTFWRPCFRFGATKVFTNDLYVVDAHVPGKILSSGNSESTVVYVGNSGINAAQNVSVAMVSGGVNSYSATQVIANLPASSTQSLAFNGFAPTLAGLNTISLTILNQDQDQQNNSVSLTQSVTCNEISGGFLPGNYPYAYFNNGQPAILAIPFSSPISRTLTAIKLKVASFSSSAGMAVAGVLCNASGSVIASTQSVVANIGSMLTMSLTTPVVLNANTNYYYGVDVLTPNTYPISADVSFPLTPAQAFEIPSGGGTPFPLLDDIGYVYGITAVFNYVAPVITAGGNKFSCSGSAVTLSASSVTGYSWTNGAQTSTISVAPVNTSTYYVRTFNAQCNTQASVAVNVSPIPTPTITGPSTLCAGSTAIYNSLGAWSYTWSSGMTGNQNPVTANSGGSQIITVQGVNVPCPAVTASFQVQVKAAPVVQIISPFSTLCNSAVGGKTLQLSGQPLGGVFSGTNVSPSGVVTPAANGVINAIYSFTNAVTTCSAAAQLQLPVSSCLGLETLNTEKLIRVFPNPSASGLFTVDAPAGSEIRLYSPDGKVIPVFLSNENLLDGSHLSPGMYLLEIRSGDSQSRIKLLKE